MQRYRRDLRGPVIQTPRCPEEETGFSVTCWRLRRPVKRRVRLDFTFLIWFLYFKFLWFKFQPENKYTLMPLRGGISDDLLGRSMALGQLLLGWGRGSTEGRWFGKETNTASVPPKQLPKNLFPTSSQVSIPMDLPYIPASCAIHAAHHTSGMHWTTQVVPDRCLEMEIPTVSRELSLARASPIEFQDQLLKWVIYKAFWTSQSLCFLANV